MRLEPLYRVRFTYPESWAVGLTAAGTRCSFLPKAAAKGR
jgi:hypothetical protein